MFTGVFLIKAFRYTLLDLLGYAPMNSLPFKLTTLALSLGALLLVPSVVGAQSTFEYKKGIRGLGVLATPAAPAPDNSSPATPPPTEAPKGLLSAQTLTFSPTAVGQSATLFV